MSMRGRGTLEVKPCDNPFFQVLPPLVRRCHRGRRSLTLHRPPLLSDHERQHRSCRGAKTGMGFSATVRRLGTSALLMPPTTPPTRFHATTLATPPSTITTTTTTTAAAAATPRHASQWVAPESYKPKKLQKDTRYDFNFMYRKVAAVASSRCAPSKLPRGTVLTPLTLLS